MNLLRDFYIKFTVDCMNEQETAASSTNPRVIK